jgi:MFS family permease
MPSMARALAATPSELQLTLSVYMDGWGVGQLFAGPLSDRFGRRPALHGARLVQVRATRPNVIIANYARLLRTPPFAAYTGVAAFGFSGLLAFLAGSAFVFVSVMGESEQGFGLLFGSVMLGNITGSTIGSRIVRRLGIERMVRGGTLLMLVAGLALGALALLATRHPLAVVVPMFVCMVAFMMTMPPATAGALTPFPQIARQRVVAVVVLPVRHCVERGVRRRLDVRWHRATDDADDCRVALGAFATCRLALPRAARRMAG